MLNAPLADVDPELYDIIEREKNRQFKVRWRLAADWMAGLDCGLDPVGGWTVVDGWTLWWMEAGCMEWREGMDAWRPSP